MYSRMRSRASASDRSSTSSRPTRVIRVGDDFPGFSEEVRVGSSGYLLDPTAFPNAAALKYSAALGRLTSPTPPATSMATATSTRSTCSAHARSRSGRRTANSSGQRRPVRAVLRRLRERLRGDLQQQLRTARDNRSDNKRSEPVPTRAPREQTHARHRRHRLERLGQPASLGPDRGAHRAPQLPRRHACRRGRQLPGGTALASTQFSANPGTVPPPRLGFSPIEPSTDDDPAAAGLRV